MIRVQFVDPARLPPRIPAVAVHRPGDVLFLMRKGMTGEQFEYWISRLGANITREAIDATCSRSQTAAQPPMRV